MPSLSDLPPSSPSRTTDRQRTTDNTLGTPDTTRPHLAVAYKLSIGTYGGVATTSKTDPSITSPENYVSYHQSFPSHSLIALASPWLKQRDKNIVDSLVKW